MADKTPWIRYTNAPEDYDYSYVKTVSRLEPMNENNRSGWRKIAITDMDRFKNFQMPRYQSGMYQVAFNKTDIWPELEPYEPKGINCDQHDWWWVDQGGE